VVWKLDRLGRNLHHLVNTVHDLTARGVGLKVLTGQGAAIDTTTAGKLVFGIFAALAEFERELISERTAAGLASAGHEVAKADRLPYKMTAAKLCLAAASMGRPDTKVSELCIELGVTRQTLCWLAGWFVPSLIEPGTPAGSAWPVVTVELVEHWTLLDGDRALVAGKRGATRLGFALLLKFYTCHGRFPNGPDELREEAVEFVARQIHVAPGELPTCEWSGRTIEYHRAQIRQPLAFASALWRMRERCGRGWPSMSRTPIHARR
jgi:Resolvase, N terminal domain/Domain of unknown function (DUF4158)